MKSTPADRLLFGTPARLLSLVLLIGVLGALAGCGEETRAIMDQRAADAQKTMAKMNQPTPAAHYNPLIVTDKVWGGDSALRMQRGMPLPAKYENDRGIAIVSAEPLSLSDIAKAISVETGIPVHLADAGAPASAPGASAASKTATPAASMQVAYEGPLSGLMEKVAGYFAVNWRYDGTTISMTRFTTRVFAVEALPGSANTEDTIAASGSAGSSSSSGGGGGGSSGGGGGSSGGSGSSSSSGPSQASAMTQNASFKSGELKYWEELDQVITAMLGGTGTVVVSPSLGSITVTTTPEIMHEVADYLAQENARMSRQIAITVEIYTVSLEDGQDFSVSFSELLKRLKNFGINYTSQAAPASLNGVTAGSTAGSLSIAILNPTPSNTRDGINSFGTDPSGGLTKGVGQVVNVFQALSIIGDTTKVAKFPLVTLNNRPVSRFVGDTIAYVANASSSTTSISGGSVTPTTTIQTGTINPGFTVQLTPRLLDDGRILLQYSLNLSSLTALTSFTSAGATVQLPNLKSNNFVQQSVLKSGSMLLLGGVDQEDTSQNSQGVGDPFNYALGGGSTTQKTHTMLFMAITPQVLDEPHSEQE